MTSTTMLRGVDYARQSKDKKVSISDQIGEATERFADEGWTRVTTLQDGKSASRHARGKPRDEWAELLRMVESGEVEVVWLWEASRGDRTAETWMGFLASCRDRGVRVFVETDEHLYNLELPRDWKILANAGVDNEYESELIRARVIRSKNVARREGNLRRVYGGRARFGWRDTAAGWVVDRAAAETLQEIAARMIAGEPLLSVHAEMVERGLMVDSYGRPVGQKGLRSVLTHPLCAGLMAKRDGTLMGKVTDGPLPVHVWERVQVDFAGRKRGRPAKDCYPLGPELRCGKCGNQLTGEQTAKGRTYKCQNPHPALGIMRGCQGTQVPSEEVHQVIAARLQEWARKSPRAKRLAVADLDLQPRRAALDAELARLQDAQADLDFKRDRGRIAPAMYQRNNDALSRDFDRVEAEQKALIEAEAHPLPVSVDWDTMTGDEKLRMTREVFVTPIVIAPYREQGTRATVKARIEPALQLR